MIHKNNMSRPDMNGNKRNKQTMVFVEYRQITEYGR